MSHTTNLVSVQSLPTPSKNRHLLVATVEEARLTGECMHEVLWLSMREMIRETPSATTLVISFQHVSHITSLTISTLLRIQRFATDRGIGLSLTDVSDGMREVFRILRLDGTVLSIEGTYAEVTANSIAI